MGRIPCCGRHESSPSNIWKGKPWECIKLCVWSHAKCLSLLALGFTHQKGLSYQIFELEDSGLPQQGILPISAKKNKNNGHRCLLNCAEYLVLLLTCCSCDPRWWWQVVVHPGSDRWVVTSVGLRGVATNSGPWSSCRKDGTEKIKQVCVVYALSFQSE